MPRKPRGTPLQPLRPDQPAGGRPAGWKLRQSERDQLNALSEEHGRGWLPEHYRTRIAAAAAATPPLPTEPDEIVGTTVRLDDELLAAVSHAATATGLQAAVWLMLINTAAGDLLLEQLAAARKASPLKSSRLRS